MTTCGTVACPGTPSASVYSAAALTIALVPGYCTYMPIFVIYFGEGPVPSFYYIVIVLLFLLIWAGPVGAPVATTVGCPGLAKSAVALACGAKVPFAWTISGPWAIGATASCPADAARLAAAAAA